MSMTTANAAAIVFNNTGLGASIGSVDPNWTLFGGGNLIDLDNNFAWVANNGTSGWIADTLLAYQNIGQGTLSFAAQTTFTVDATRFASFTGAAALSGQILFDDCGFVYLNSALVMQDCGADTGSYTALNGDTGYGAWTALSIPSTFFVLGTNTMVVYDYNSGQAYGVRVELSDPTTTSFIVTGGGTGDTPEPAAISLLALGAVLFAVRKLSVK